jgi:hypothetical protein
MRLMIMNVGSAMKKESDKADDMAMIMKMRNVLDVIFEHYHEHVFFSACLPRVIHIASNAYSKEDFLKFAASLWDKHEKSQKRSNPK